MWLLKRLLWWKEYEFAARYVRKLLEVPAFAVSGELEERSVCVE